MSESRLFRHISIRAGGRLLTCAALGLFCFGLAAVATTQIARADCQVGTDPDDGGSISGYVWIQQITGYMSGDCGGSHYVAYEYENGANANVWIDVGTARAWICGTPSSIGGPAVFGLDYDIWSGWAGPNSCGFQADQSTHFWLTGVFDDWTYTNIDS